MFDYMTDDFLRIATDEEIEAHARGRLQAALQGHGMTFFVGDYITRLKAGRARLRHADDPFNRCCKCGAEILDVHGILSSCRVCRNCEEAAAPKPQGCDGDCEAGNVIRFPITKRDHPPMSEISDSAKVARVIARANRGPALVD